MKTDKTEWWDSLTKYQRQSITNENYPHLSKIDGPTRAMYYLSPEELQKLYENNYNNI